MLKKRITCKISCAIIAIVFIFPGCDRGGSDDKLREFITWLVLFGPAPYGTPPVEPDAAPSPTDPACSCGVKTSAGSAYSSSFSSSSGGIKLARGPWQRYVPGEMIVKFRDGTSQARITQVLGASSAASVKSLFARKTGERTLFKHFRLPAGKGVEQAVAEFSKLSEVEYAEPNYIYRAFATPDDYNYGSLWGLHNTGQTVNGTTGSIDKDIDAPEAWNLVTDCSNVIVAVVDTGINYNHRELSPNMWNGGSAYPKSC